MKILEEKLKEILNLEWEDNDKKLLSQSIENCLYYKRLIPKKFQADIITLIDLCIKEKFELDILRSKCQCQCQNLVSADVGLDKTSIDNDGDE